MGLHQADQKKVIVNADDFGLSRQINRGIIEAHHAGMLRSASLLANGPAAAEAIEAASGNRGLGVGLHLTLVFGEPVSPKDKVGSLLTRGGEFPRGYPSFVSRYFSGGVRLREVEYEWERQMERGAPAGLSQ